MLRQARERLLDDTHVRAPSKLMRPWRIGPRARHSDRCRRCGKAERIMQASIVKPGDGWFGKLPVARECCKQSRRERIAGTDRVGDLDRPAGNVAAMAAGEGGGTVRSARHDHELDPTLDGAACE